MFFVMEMKLLYLASNNIFVMIEFSTFNVVFNSIQKVISKITLTESTD